MNQLPAGWVECSLSDICEPVEKVDPTATPDKEIHYIDIGSVGSGPGRLLGAQVLAGKAAPSRARQLVAAGDVLFSTVRTYLMKTTAVPADLDGAVASTGFCVLRPNPSINPSLVLHAVRQPEFVERISAVQSGSSYPAVRDRDVRAMPIRLPPLPEQERIVAAIEEAFSLLDAGETALRNTRARLKRMRDAVLTAAVTGKLLPQDPTDTRPSVELADRVEPFGPHDAPPLPESWIWVRLASIATEVRNGVFASRPASQPPGIPILRIGAVRPMALDLADVRYADLDAADPAVHRALLVGGDLLFTRYNGNPEFVGACAAVPPTIGRVLHPDKLIRVKIHAAVALPSYVEIAAAAGASRTFIRSVTKTTAGQAGISGSDLKRMPLPLPPLEEQGRIVAEVERQFSFIDAAERAVDEGLRRSAALRRSVLRAAFEGRLVPQDPADEPASVLLERIAAERAAAQPKKRAPRRVRGKAEVS